MMWSFNDRMLLDVGRGPFQLFHEFYSKFKDFFSKFKDANLILASLNFPIS